MKLHQRIGKHVSEHRWYYTIISSIFILGLVLGNYKAGALDAEVKSHLLGLLDQYLKEGGRSTLSGQALLIQSFLNQARSLALMWFLGLTVIGIPLILGLVLWRGFSLGFTVGFLIQERGGTGIVLTILSILPQNLIYIPLLLMWAVIAIKFSLFILQGRREMSISLGRGMILYTLLLLFFLLLALCGALVEAYLSPLFLSIVT